MRLASRKPTVLPAAIGLTSAVAGFVAAGASVASIPARYGIDIQAIYSPAGNPSLVANFSPDGALAKARWSICRTPDVNGSVQAHTSGQVFATVTPHRAVWTGGWAWQRPYRRKDGLDSGGRGPDFDFLSVEACRTRDAEKCVDLSEPQGDGFGRRPPVMGKRFTDWYLFAFDQRLAADTASAAPAYRTPASVPPLNGGATVARSGPLGPLVGPPVPGASTQRRAIAR